MLSDTCVQALGCSANIPAITDPALKFVNKIATLVGRQNVLAQVKRTHRSVHDININSIIGTAYDRRDVTGNSG